MVRTLFERPHILYQTTDDDMSMPEPAIWACVDGGGLVLIGQEGREIVVNKASAKELAKLILDLSKG